MMPRELADYAALIRPTRYREQIFALRRHIIGNILFLAEDRQKRPKVGSVLDALLGGLGYDDKQR